MSSRLHTKLIHEGQYAAEVEVSLIETDEGWSPYMSLAETQKLDTVRQALGRVDLIQASQMARVFQLTPVHA